MKNLFKLTLSLLLLLVVVSCSKEDQLFEDELQTSEQLTTQVAQDVLRNSANSEDCLTINYPYSLSNGETETQINDDQELADYLLGLDENEPVFFVYPLEVTVADGSTVVLQSEDELYALVADCADADGDDGDDGEDDGANEGNGNSDADVATCFTVNFPATLLDDQGQEVVVNSTDEQYSYENPHAFVWPVDITFNEDGVETTVENEDTYFAYLSACHNDGSDPDGGYDDDGNDDGNEDGNDDGNDNGDNNGGNDDGNDNADDDPGVTCYEVLFPHTIITSDGGQTVVNDAQELLDLLQSLPEDVDFNLGFPVDVQLPDGSQQTVNSQDELDALSANC